MLVFLVIYVASYKFGVLKKIACIPKMKFMRKIILFLLFLGFLVFADSQAKYIICFCVDNNHVSVHLYDGSTGQMYGRGFYALGHGSDKNAPKIPNAGGTLQGQEEPVPSDAERSLFGGYGTIQDDDGLIGKKCICYEITEEQYNKVANYMNNYEHRYNVATQNCVDFAQDTGEQIGIELPSSTDFLGVSEPKILYRILNNMRSEQLFYEENPDLAKVKSKSFPYIIIYGSNETERLEKKFNFTINKTNKNTTEEAKQYKVQQEMNAHAEDVLGNPDDLYKELIGKGSTPTETTVWATAPQGESCGTDCIKVDKDTPINFSPSFTPPQYSFVWWDFGDGYKAVMPNPTHTYSELGQYPVKMRYLDESETLKFATYKVVVSENEFGLPDTRTFKVSTPSGNEIIFENKKQLDETKAENEAQAELTRISSYGLRYVIGDERTIIHFKLKNGKVIMMTWSPSDNYSPDSTLRVLGTVDAENEKLFEDNPQVFIDCVPVTFTGALYVDEETLENIAQSDTPSQAFKDAWGTKIVYKGLTLGNTIKSFFVDLGVKLGFGLGGEGNGEKENGALAACYRACNANRPPLAANLLEECYANCRSEYATR